MYADTIVDERKSQWAHSKWNAKKNPHLIRLYSAQHLNESRFYCFKGPIELRIRVDLSWQNRQFVFSTVNTFWKWYHWQGNQKWRCQQFLKRACAVHDHKICNRRFEFEKQQTTLVAHWKVRRTCGCYLLLARKKSEWTLPHASELHSHAIVFFPPPHSTNW